MQCPRHMKNSPFQILLVLFALSTVALASGCDFIENQTSGDDCSTFCN